MRLTLIEVVLLNWRSAAPCDTTAVHVLSVAQLVHMHACLWLSGGLQELKRVLGGNILKLFCLIDSDDNGYVERNDWVAWFEKLQQNRRSMRRDLSDGVRHSGAAHYNLVCLYCRTGHQYSRTVLY